MTKLRQKTKAGLEQTIEIHGNPLFITFANHYAQRMDGLVENNEWHDHETVLHHTIMVLQGLRQLVTQFKLEHFVSQKLDNASILQILEIVCLFHDVGKLNCHPKSENDKIYFPRHEKIGAAIAKNEIGRLSAFSKNNQHLICKLIYLHNTFHTLFDRLQSSDAVAKFFRQNEMLGRLLLLIGYADMYFSDLRHLNQPDFIRRFNLFKQAMKTHVKCDDY